MYNMYKYNVENINENNLFVIKRDNAVRNMECRGAAEPTYYPAGALVHIPYLPNNVFITDAMLESAKAGGARKKYSGTIFPSGNNELHIDTAEVMPCQLRRATKEEVAQCIKYAEEYNNALEEHYRKQEEDYKKECAKYKAEEERKARELDEFRGSLKGKWMKFVTEVMRKLAVELLFLAGKCNKKQIANNKRLGYCYHDTGNLLLDDSFKKIYGVSVEDYVKKRKEFMSSGHSSWEWDKKFFGKHNSCPTDGMQTLRIALGYIEK